MEDYLEYHKRINDFSIEFRKIVESNKKHKIKNLISSDAYSNLTIEEKEGQIFISSFIEKNEEVLKYLIFDYGIKENYFSEWYQNKNEHTVNILGVSEFQEIVKQMFKTRRLNEELNKELGISSDTSKKPKV